MRALRSLIAALALTMLVGGARADNTRHVVQDGQTLGGIARRYRVTIDALVQANRISRSDPIRPGQELTIPSVVEPRTAEGADDSRPSASAAGREHVVQDGQTLGGIARSHGVALSALARANNMSDNDTLRVGQRLSIPKAGEPVRSSQRMHTVVSGNTLGGIAKRYGVTIELLLEANRIRRNAPLRIGQKLAIPGEKRTSPSAAESPAASEPSEPPVAPAPPSATTSSSGMQRLPLPGAQAAYYYEPTGAGRLTLRPVLVYMHGRGARPAEYCQRWARVVRNFGWLVCPVGPEDRGGGQRGWGNDWGVGRRLATAAVNALRKKYGRRVQLYGNTIMGFSEGAFIAMNVGLHEPRVFNRWLILAADDEYWGPVALAALDRHRGHIRRVYLITGRRDQVYEQTQQVKKWLQRAGVAVRMSAPKDMGHTVALESKPAMYRAALHWLERG
jgi:LysM repeat protein/predicted esterase